MLIVFSLVLSHSVAFANFKTTVVLAWGLTKAKHLKPNWQ